MEVMWVLAIYDDIDLNCMVIDSGFQVCFHWYFHLMLRDSNQGWVVSIRGKECGLVGGSEVVLRIR